jgi:hypothetical protein
MRIRNPLAFSLACLACATTPRSQSATSRSPEPAISAALSTTCLGDGVCVVQQCPLERPRALRAAKRRVSYVLASTSGPRPVSSLAPKQVVSPLRWRPPSTPRVESPMLVYCSRPRSTTVRASVRSWHESFDPLTLLGDRPQAMWCCSVARRAAAQQGDEPDEVRAGNGNRGPRRLSPVLGGHLRRRTGSRHD